MRGEEDEHDVGGDRANTFLHHPRDVAVAFDCPRRRTVSNAAADEQDEEPRDQRGVERLQPPRACRFLVDQRRVTGDQRQRRIKPDHGERRQPCPAQPAAFVRHHFGPLQFGLHILVGLAIPFAQARLDDPVGNEPDDRRVEHHDGQDEPPVAERVHGPFGIDDPRRFLGEAEQQYVDLPRRDVAGIAARHRRERRRQPGERMPPDRGVDDRGERDEHDIGRVRRVVRYHPDQRHDRRQDRLGRFRERNANQRREHARPLGHRRAEHDHEDQPQRRKAAHRARHFGQQPADILFRKQAGRRIGQHPAVERCPVGRLLAAKGQAGRPADPLADRRQQHQHQDQPDENHRRFGEQIARPLDKPEKAALARGDVVGRSWIGDGWLAAHAYAPINSRPISIRRTSLVPAPMSSNLASR